MSGMGIVGIVMVAFLLAEGLITKTRILDTHRLAATSTLICPQWNGLKSPGNTAKLGFWGNGLLLDESCGRQDQIGNYNKLTYNFLICLNN